MSTMLRVAAVPGRMCPMPGRPGAFIGLTRTRVTPEKPAPEGAALVTGGYAFVATTEAVELPDTTDLRRALARGDCVLAPAPIAIVPARAKSVARDTES